MSDGSARTQASIMEGNAYLWSRQLLAASSKAETTQLYLNSLGSSAFAIQAPSTSSIVVQGIVHAGPGFLVNCESLLKPFVLTSFRSRSLM